jgi:tripartite ATP-independent transporter DctP family solute receptor
MITRRALLAGAVPALMGATVREPQVLTAADVHVEHYPTVEAVRFIGEKLAQGTGGRLGIRIYHSGQLGREGDTVEMVRYGAIDLTRVSFAGLNNAFPATGVAALPYVFDSTDHMRRAIDGAPGKEIRRQFERRGLVGLCIYDSGVRSFYNVRRAIHVPDDLHGLKVRVPPSDIFIALASALGANPTPLPYGEVYSALQTHLIDGAENNLRTFHSTRQFEVARYWSETRHSYAPEALLMSRRRFESLDARDRELLLAAVEESVSYMRVLWDGQEAKSRAAVVESGVKINEVDQAAFRAAAGPLLSRYLADADAMSLYRSIRDLA